jgi:carbon-monoxide dehydrogenase medium subunit
VKPPAFDYFDPRTPDEALALLREHGDEAKILAGGQSLVPMLNLRLLRPGCLVDINQVAGLSFIEMRGGELVIGATTRQRAVERSALVAEHCPLLHEAMPFIAHFQIRNRGTIGGSLSHADPAAELPTVVSALGGKLVLRSARGERVLSAPDFYTGYLSTALQPDELMTEIRLPVQRAGTGVAFLEVSRRHGDFALAAVAACVELNAQGACASACLVLAGVAGTPFRHPGAEKALVGTKLSRSELEQASGLLVGELEPLADLHASSDYRKEAARVLAVRAFEQAASRARA